MFHNDEMSEFSKNLKKLMAKRGMNQVALAKAAGIERVSITGYLSDSRHGKLPSLKNLIALASALHCSIEELVGIDSPKKPGGPSPESIRMAEAILKLPEDSPARRAIETLIEQYLDEEGGAAPHSK